MGKIPLYHDDFSIEWQIDSQDRIAALIFDKEPALSEETCAELGRQILKEILWEYRRDLFHGSKDVEYVTGWYCRGCGHGPLDETAGACPKCKVTWGPSTSSLKEPLGGGATCQHDGDQCGREV